ncbi:MAG: chitobiase/beta-hexosaminidase C-terminal domain-containing protein [Verrucomicrobia bacterium]|nr:chitobiase/beta-hexosaminidase C-terminal domain-containing protein [Verrucomicrobiota bacterium]
MDERQVGVCSPGFSRFGPPKGGTTNLPRVVHPTVSSVSWLVLLLLVFAWLPPLAAQVQVRTLGGGRTSAAGPDAGYRDGNTLQNSQFNFPAGVVVDLTGNLFVADRDNGAVRKLDLSANRASTFLSGLNQPVALAVDRTNNLYVLTRGDTQLRRIDRFGNISALRVPFIAPTALALDRTDALYVTDAGGKSVVRIEPGRETARTVAQGLNQPSGIAILESGLVAVSETDNHRVLFLDPETGAIIDRIGTGVAGFRDGSHANAQFNQPHHLARAPDGSVLVADRMNHRVRLIRPEGVVVTLYGVDPQAWEGPECLNCDPIILPGWFDSNAEFAEAREPFGVSAGSDGKVYTTEAYYHLVREVTGAGLTAAPGSAGAGTNLVVLPPIITPESGYYPLGQDITVINPNTNSFFSNRIFYTTDATDPTTNSFRLALSNNVGAIRWRETTRDLTSLRVVAFVGASASEVVKGKPVATNEIGVTRDIAAGPGSTTIVPITVNLRLTEQLKSLQFRVEVAPSTADLPAIPDQFRALSFSTNELIRIVTSAESEGVSTFGAFRYDDGPARGLAITFIGTNANFSVKNFGVVAMLAVPIPSTAASGSRYEIRILNPSGTSDALEKAVPLGPMKPRQIVVSEVGFLAGDSSPASWYNADRLSGGLGFGDGALNNNDVNNAFSASLGVRVPYPFSDLFSALDAYPEDTRDAAGGDGLIRFLDWQIVLRRSLGLDASRWFRLYSTNGLRTSTSGESAALANLPASSLAESANSGFWLRQAAISAAAQENVQPGAPVAVPVYLTVGTGFQVSGLAFRATLYPEGDAPPLQQPLQFVPAAGLAKPIQNAGIAPNDLLCGWPIVPNYSFNPPLQNRTLLGQIQVTLPNTARAGQVYTLRFSNADGSPNLTTQYDFETRPASLWVQTTAQQKPEIISDEWRIRFFGSVTAESAQPDWDPDNDGLSNLGEYLAGTSPVSASSTLRLEAQPVDGTRNRVVLRWLGIPGRTYTIEAAGSLLEPDWKPLASDLIGSGSVQEFMPADAFSTSRFYRLRLQTQNTSE